MVRGRPRTTKTFAYQTGKRKSLSADRKRKAMKPGKRVSESGKTYTETRRNRTDVKGKSI